MKWDAQSGMLLTSIMGEAKNTPGLGVTTPMDYGQPGTDPPKYPKKPATGTQAYPNITLPTSACTSGSYPTGPYNLYGSFNLDGSGSSLSQVDFKKFFPCQIRQTVLPNPAWSIVNMTGTLSKLNASGSWVIDNGSIGYNIYGLDSNQNRILTANNEVYSGSGYGTRYHDFSPLANSTEIWGIEVAVQPTFWAGSVIAYSVGWSNVNNILGAPDGSLASFTSGGGGTGIIVLAFNTNGISNLPFNQSYFGGWGGTRYGLIGDQYINDGNHPSDGGYGIDWTALYTPSTINDTGVGISLLSNPVSYHSNIYYARAFVQVSAGGTAYIDAVGITGSYNNGGFVTREAYKLAADSLFISNVC
jgi:hypothetical protein